MALAEGFVLGIWATWVGSGLIGWIYVVATVGWRDAEWSDLAVAPIAALLGPYGCYMIGRYFDAE